jgi:hypothetical protein
MGLLAFNHPSVPEAVRQANPRYQLNQLRQTALVTKVN